MSESPPDLGPGTPANDDQRRVVLLAEYAAVNQEIGRRSDAQQPLLALSITALAAIASVVVSRSSARPAVLLIPLVTATCGLLWLDHAKTIRTKGKYIGGQLRSAIVAELPDPDCLLQNEDLTRREELNLTARILANTSMLFFAASSLAATGVGLDLLIGSHPIAFADRWLRALAWTGWTVGLLLTLFYALGVLSYVREPFREVKQNSQPRDP